MLWGKGLACTCALRIFGGAVQVNLCLAAIACAHLIRWCEQAGSASYWDCAALNAGSRALARKLGFRNERAYRLLAWFGPGLKAKE